MTRRTVGPHKTPKGKVEIARYRWKLAVREQRWAYEAADERLKRDGERAMRSGLGEDELNRLAAEA